MEQDVGRRQRRRATYLAVVFGAHLVLALSVSIESTMSVVSDGLTIFRRSAGEVARRRSTDESKLDRAADAGQRVLTSYLHLTGIQAGYGYFAPNVPTAYELVVEVHSPDVSPDRLPLDFSGREAKMRWSSLLDYVGRVAEPEVREVLLKLIAHSVRRLYPDATKMHVTIEKLNLPTAHEFQSGKRPSRHAMVTYEFVFDNIPSAPLL